MRRTPILKILGVLLLFFLCMYAFPTALHAEGSGGDNPDANFNNTNSNSVNPTPPTTQPSTGESKGWFSTAWSNIKGYGKRNPGTAAVKIVSGVILAGITIACPPAAPYTVPMSIANWTHTGYVAVEGKGPLEGDVTPKPGTNAPTDASGSPFFDGGAAPGTSDSTFTPPDTGGAPPVVCPGGHVN